MSSFSIGANQELKDPIIILENRSKYKDINKVRDAKDDRCRRKDSIRSDRNIPLKMHSCVNTKGGQYPLCVIIIYDQNETQNSFSASHPRK